MHSRRAAYFSLFILTVSEVCQGGKVLVNMTPQTKSHAMGLIRIATELAERGHEIMYLVLESDIEGFRIPRDALSCSYEMASAGNGPQDKEFRLSSKRSMSSIMINLEEMLGRACTGMMTNNTMLGLLKEFDADVMLAEAFYSCTAMLASRLDIPWVNYFPAAPMEPYLTSIWASSPRRAFVPNPLSYFPQNTMSATTQFMSFTQRLENMYHFVHDALQDAMYHRPPTIRLYEMFGFNPNAPEERRRLVLTMAPVDWAAEWLRPVAPNFKMVGPILSQPGRPLPADLEEFMESAGEQGVLLIALGTVTETSKEQRLLMAEALARLPCKVLWRLSPREVPDEAAIAGLNLGSNTKVATWVPQNDVLAHPKLRAFLSHCGVNSMYEAIYHGKPVVAMPFFGDQPNNADKMVAKGMAERIGLPQRGSTAFYDALLKVLTEERYARAAQALSVKIRAHKRTPVQRAADWVEHVMDTKGDPYMKMPDDELSFVVRHNLDIFAFLAACLGLSATLAQKLLSLALGRLLGSSGLVLRTGRQPPKHFFTKVKGI